MNAVPSVAVRAYASFLIECTETASVMVSINPDPSDVTRIRKLRGACQYCTGNGQRVLSDPAGIRFFAPNPPKLLDQLDRELLLSQVRSRLDDDRDDVPIWQMSVRRGDSDSRHLVRKRLPEHGAWINASADTG